MKVRLFSKVLLSDGRTAYIVEIFSDGKTFLADIDLEDGDVSTDEIHLEDLKKVLKY